MTLRISCSGHFTIDISQPGDGPTSPGQRHGTGARPLRVHARTGRDDRPQPTATSASETSSSAERELFTGLIAQLHHYAGQIDGMPSTDAMAVATLVLEALLEQGAVPPATVHDGALTERLIAIVENLASQFEAPFLTELASELRTSPFEQDGDDPNGDRNTSSEQPSNVIPFEAGQETDTTGDDPAAPDISNGHADHQDGDLDDGDHPEGSDER